MKFGYLDVDESAHMMESVNANKSDALEILFRSCSSIIKTVQSLKTIQPRRFDDTDAIFDQERDISRWLDQQVLDYEVPLNELPTLDPCSTAKSKKGLQQELLQKAWDQNYQPHLLAQRIQMSKAATDVMNSDTKSALVQEAVKSRNAMVDNVIKLQGELDTVQKKLSLVTVKCRKVQEDAKNVWAKEKQSVLDNKSMSSTEMKNWVLRQILMDLIVESDNLDLYNDKRLAQLLLTLEER